MRYSWKKAFLLGMCLVYGCLSGCQGTAVLYDSTEGQEAEAADVGNGGTDGLLEEAPAEKTGEEKQENRVFVYVCGEVEAAGVYELPEGSRIVDAVEAAGGMTEEASGTWLNLAEPVSDGQKIEVPSREQAEELVRELEAEKDGGAKLLSIEKKKEKKAVAPEDVVCDLLPVSIVVDEYFAEKRDVIAAAEELLAQNEAQLTELVEEQAENYLDEDNFPDSKMTDANVKKRIKALDKKTDAEEIDVLQKYLDLKGDISLNKKLIKERKYDLLTALVVKYANLSEEEIKQLVIEKKWFASLALRLDGEMQRISQQLTSKISALAERYAQTLPEIDDEISGLEAKVAAHLKQMRYWSEKSRLQSE